MDFLHSKLQSQASKIYYSIRGIKTTAILTTLIGVAQVILKDKKCLSLKCLSSRVVATSGIDYKDKVPRDLIPFIELHAGSESHAPVVS